MSTANNTRANIFELQDLEVRRFLAVSANISSGTLVVTGSDSSETIEFKLSGSNVTVAGKSFATSAFTRISVDAKGGNDVIKVDQAITNYTSATLGGGNGNDNITGGSKADLIRGDSGFDTANYSARAGAVRVSLDGAANDGANSGAEGDNVQCEEVLGGSGADIFTGGSGDDFFGGGAGKDTGVGNAGDDELVGSTGSDNLQGKDGDDSIYAKNNDADSVNGGTNSDGSSDLDLAEVDGIDTTSGVALRATLAAAGFDVSALDASSLDPTFDGDGVNSGPAFEWDDVNAATVDSQGRTILVGSAFTDDGTGYGGDEDFAVVRYNADGSFDSDFGEVRIDFGGGYGDDDFAYGVTTDENDSIIIVGSTQATSIGKFNDDFAIARLLQDGTPDADFGNNGRVRQAIIQETDVSDEAVDVVVANNGDLIVVGGTNFGEFSGDIAVARFTSTGDLDDSFSGGTQVFDFGEDAAAAVALQNLPSDEGAQRIVIAGASGPDALLFRLFSDGSFDHAITANPDPENGFALYNDVAVNADNEIFAVGRAQFGVIIGALDPTPNDGDLGFIGKYDADMVPQVFQYEEGAASSPLSFNAVAVDALSDTIVVAGTNDLDYVVGRYNMSDLAADANFNGGEPVYTDIEPQLEGNLEDVALGVGVLADGKIIAAGYTEGFDGTVTSVARYGEADDGDNGDETDISEVENIISFDDVQNDNGSRRSSTATFYIKSTHLDDQGRATINLTNGKDILNISKVTTEDGDDQVIVDVDGVCVLSYDLTTTLITINCNNGDDVVNVSDDVTIPLRIYGQNGNDRIGGGAGNDQLDGGNGNDTVTGGSGHDVLLGGGNGNDNLSGGNGNDIMIGGNGGDILNGNAGEDILIGGATVYDNNGAALESLSAEWRSGDATTNAARVNNLRFGGGLNGTNVLKVGSGATVFDDGTRDQLTGGSERDWFFRRNSGSNSARDSILDNLAGEEVTNF